MYTSVAKCVLRRTHSGSVRACAKAPSCMDEIPCVEATPCVCGVFASVPECVLPGTPCVKGEPQPETARVCEAWWVSGTTCAQETARVCEQPCGSEARCVRKAACVRSVYAREMSVGMREHAAASPGVNGMVRSVSLVTRGSLSAWVERRRRLRQLRDKGRVAAIVAMGTAPGLHGSECAVRAVQRTRPPRARLRE